MTYNREFTSDFITELKPNEIFVFGSNIGGFHGGGAARVAHKRFGAEWGVGEGITGQCYALPTMEGGVDYIAGKVNAFIACAKQHPELKFLVTKVACGIAGFSELSFHAFRYAEDGHYLCKDSCCIQELLDI